ncbi:Phosphatidylinositol transfer protein alpha isoform [Blattella germanica]|nr:Phosphatidylinositol transfer protein alpha isoform [Blattella germanica]
MKCCLFMSTLFGSMAVVVVVVLVLLVLAESWLYEREFHHCNRIVTFSGHGNAAKRKSTGVDVHELPPEKLKHREVVHIDIANDPVTHADYKPDEDPTKFKSEKTGRGPLVGQWMDKVNPVMTCYKLVTVEFKWFGLQTRIENFIQKSERRLFTNFHRQVFCWMDRWHGLTMEDIRAIEDKTKEELDKQRNVGEVRGMKAEAD